MNREEFIQVQKEQEPISAQDPGSTSNQLTDEEKEKILALVENETEVRVSFLAYFSTFCSGGGGGG